MLELTSGYCLMKHGLYKEKEEIKEKMANFKNIPRKF